MLSINVVFVGVLGTVQLIKSKSMVCADKISLVNTRFSNIFLTFLRCVEHEYLQ